MVCRIVSKGEVIPLGHSYPFGREDLEIIKYNQQIQCHRSGDVHFVQ